MLGSSSRVLEGSGGGGGGGGDWHCLKGLKRFNGFEVFRGCARNL